MLACKITVVNWRKHDLKESTVPSGIFLNKGKSCNKKKKRNYEKKKTAIFWG